MLFESIGILLSILFFFGFFFGLFVAIAQVASGTPYFSSSYPFSAKGDMRFEISPSGWISYLKYEIYNNQNPYARYTPFIAPTLYLGGVVGGCLGTLVPQTIAISIFLAITFVFFVVGTSGAAVYYVIFGGEAEYIGGGLFVLGIGVVFILL